LMEDDRAASLRHTEDLLKESFRDPEGWFYMARQFGYLNAPELAMRTLSTAIDMGYFCYPGMVRDPWLAKLRGIPEYNEILNKARALHQQALDIFTAEGGESLLGIREPSSVH